LSYCKKCGAKLSDEEKFCSKCGEPVSASTTIGAKGTGLDKIQRDSQLQNLYLYRFIAFIIDAIIIAIIIGIISLLALPLWFIGAGFYLFSPYTLTVGIISILYFSVLESYRGSTLGKGLLNLKVHTLNGDKPDFGKALIRNISKIHWLLLLLDIIVGLATEGEPSQKFSDRYAGTVVTKKS
jgi:uncharacterized RDD family membrane protein YckC